MARRPITLGAMGDFEIDDDGKLYWQGERVLTDVRLSLSRPANAAVIVAATAGLFGIAVLQAVGALPPPTAITVVIDRSIIEPAETTPAEGASSDAPASEGSSGTRSRRGT